jgi:DNA invertase Pin-like site-specific DNA recombinase
MKIGYVRCSTKEQNSERQEVLMKELGVDRVYMDMLSGKDLNRPRLQEMMQMVMDGDIVIVESISRFARNTKDLLDLIDKLTKKHVQFVSKKEAIDTSTPTGKFMLTVFGAVAELERDYILQRQAEGIALKKARGEYKGRVPITVDKKKFEQEYKLWKSEQITARAAMEHLKLKPNTFYRRVSEYEKKEMK